MPNYNFKHLIIQQFYRKVIFNSSSQCRIGITNVLSAAIFIIVSVVVVVKSRYVKIIENLF